MKKLLLSLLLAVSVASSGFCASKAVVTTAQGRLAYGSVTNSYQALLSSVSSVSVLVCSNSLDTETTVSLDGGTTAFLVLQPSQSFAIDFTSDELLYAGTVSVKYTGSAPASGAISCGVIER